MELADETFNDRRESSLDIKIENQQVRPTPDGYAAPAPAQARKALRTGLGGVFVYRWARARSRWGSSDGVHRTY